MPYGDPPIGRCTCGVYSVSDPRLIPPCPVHSPMQAHWYPYIYQHPGTVKYTTGTGADNAGYTKEQVDELVRKANREGYEEGYGDGYNEGWNFPRKDANTAELDQARKEGYDQGWDDGYREKTEEPAKNYESYEDGYSNGWKDAIEHIRNKIREL